MGEGKSKFPVELDRTTTCGKRAKKGRDEKNNSGREVPNEGD